MFEIPSEYKLSYLFPSAKLLLNSEATGPSENVMVIDLGNTRSSRFPLHKTFIEEGKFRFATKMFFNSWQLQLLYEAPSIRNKLSEMTQPFVLKDVIHISGKLI